MTFEELDSAKTKGFLIVVTRNAAIDIYRKRHDTVSLDEEADEVPSIKFQILDKKCKPHEKCISSELEKLIRTAIMALPEQFRVAIVLRELQGLSYEEIAAATHSSIGTVKSRIARARGKLQEDLKAYI